MKEELLWELLVKLISLSLSLSLFLIITCYLHFGWPSYTAAAPYPLCSRTTSSTTSSTTSTHTTSTHNTLVYYLPSCPSTFPQPHLITAIPSLILDTPPTPPTHYHLHDLSTFRFLRPPTCQLSSLVLNLIFFFLPSLSLRSSPTFSCFILALGPSESSH